MSAQLRVDRQPPADWRRLALNGGLFYHHPDWIEGLGQCFRFPVWYLSVVHGNRIVGILPLARVPGLAARSRLVSLPFSYAAGIVAESPEAGRLLAAGAIELARDVGAGHVELKHAGTSEAVGVNYTPVHRYDTYRLDLADATADPLGPASQSVRRGVRTAERAGIVVKQGSDDDWMRMAELQELTSHRLGVPPPPRAFFTHLCRRLGQAGLASLFLAREPDGAIAAAIVVWRGRREWIYAFGASNSARLQHRPNHAVLAHAVREAAAAGVAFDFGRAAPEQEGLVEFKRRWGAQPVPLSYDYWPAPRGLNTANRKRGVLAVAGRIWSHLPVSVARRGAFLYRYLG